MLTLALPWVSNPVAQAILRRLQVAYPIILLGLYLVAFTTHSIWTARREEHPSHHDPPPRGPGGKPLPRTNSPAKQAAGVSAVLDFSRPRKLLFEWLSVAVIATFIANIVVVIIHALVERNERWWCGIAPTVSPL